MTVACAGGAPLHGVVQRQRYAITTAVSISAPPKRDQTNLMSPPSCSCARIRDGQHHQHRHQHAGQDACRGTGATDTFAIIA